MKTLLSTIGALAIAFAVSAQTLTVTNQAPAPTEWYMPLTNAWSSVVANSSNLLFAPFAAVMTSGQKKGTAGGGIEVAYAMYQFMAPGVAFYYLGNWQMVNGQLQLMMPLPLSNKVKVTPGVMGGVGTTLQGGGESNGQVTVLTQVFMNVDIFQVAGWNVGVGGFWGTITGAGQYSGQDAGGFIKGSRGF
jgi:hypothetical protein